MSSDTLVEPSNDEQPQWPEATENYVRGLEERIEALEAEVAQAAKAEERAKLLEQFRQPSVDLAASLAAAISLLERGGKAAKKAAPSDKMFDQMLEDYKASLNRARKALAAFVQENSIGR